MHLAEHFEWPVVPQGIMRSGSSQEQRPKVVYTTEVTIPIEDTDIRKRGGCDSRKCVREETPFPTNDGPRRKLERPKRPVL